LQSLMPKTLDHSRAAAKSASYPTVTSGALQSSGSQGFDRRTEAHEARREPKHHRRPSPDPSAGELP
jgi:hypothetical protein